MDRALSYQRYEARTKDGGEIKVLDRVVLDRRKKRGRRNAWVGGCVVAFSRLRREDHQNPH
jgi:hypothetical protein